MPGSVPSWGLPPTPTSDTKRDSRELCIPRARQAAVESSGDSRCRREWRSRLSGMEVQLPPLDVVPGAALPADAPVGPDGNNPDRAVQSVARLVRLGDPGAQRPQADRSQPLEESCVERAPDAGPMMVRVDVDGDVRRPAVRGALAVRRAVRIADRDALVLGDDPGVGRADATRDLLHGRRPLLEGH